jgi:hypothetical protein
MAIHHFSLDGLNTCGRRWHCSLSLGHLGIRHRTWRPGHWIGFDAAGGQRKSLLEDPKEFENILINNDISFFDNVDAYWE